MIVILNIYLNTVVVTILINLYMRFRVKTDKITRNKVALIKDRFCDKKPISYKKILKIYLLPGFNLIIAFALITLCFISYEDLEKILNDIEEKMKI